MAFMQCIGPYFLNKTVALEAKEGLAHKRTYPHRVVRDVQQESLQQLRKASTLTASACT